MRELLPCEKQAVKMVKDLIRAYKTVEVIGATPDSRRKAGIVVEILEAGLLAFERKKDETTKS